MAEDINSGDKPKEPELPCIARVVSHGDGTYMGMLRVELLRNVGNNNETQAGQVIDVSYMSPFFGATSVDHVVDDPDDYNNTQKSYGMWMIPPDPGSYVMVIFHNGQIEKGYWIGCIPYDQGINFMVPGVAATTFNNEDSSKKLPVADFNKRATSNTGDETKVLKPRHPFADVLEAQGLLEDDTRGITSSSARRETPSMVFGISTPGPFDKQSGSKRGVIGEAPGKIQDAVVSHLGGSSFVMDDGDDKYIREKTPKEGPPKYIAVEQVDKEELANADVTIPHNELIRIRTRTGHQILLHNSEDLIYIGNARGTTWIELTSNGKIDIYAQDSISVHSENDINFTADRDINLTAGRNINSNAGTNINSTAGAVVNVKSGDNTNINPGGDFHVLAANTAIDGGDINLNSGVAGGAEAAPKAFRIPQTEPWAGHENLDPTSHTPANTEATAEPTLAEPEYFKKYSTDTDTFAQILPVEKNPEEDQP